MTKPYIPAVGDEVVLFYAGHPCAHNSVHFPAHPCRGKVLTVGPKYATINSTYRKGIRVPLAPMPSNNFTILPVVEAKAIYRAILRRHPPHRTPQFIAELVEEL